MKVKISQCANCEKDIIKDMCQKENNTHLILYDFTDKSSIIFCCKKCLFDYIVKEIAKLNEFEKEDNFRINTGDRGL